MTADELKKLDAAITAKRAEREKINTDAEAMRVKAQKLSAEIREMERNLPTDKQRRGIMMAVQPANVSLKPGR